MTTLSYSLDPSTFIWDSSTDSIHITRWDLFPVVSDLGDSWHAHTVQVRNPATCGGASFRKYSQWLDHYVAFMARVPDPNRPTGRIVKLFVWDDYDILRANYHKHGNRNT
jgi:hypothetical protein